MADFFQLLWQKQLSDSITAITVSSEQWAASSAAGEIVGGQDSNDLVYCQLAPDLEITAPQAISCLAYSPDGRYLAAAGQAGTIQIWHIGQPLDQPWQTIPPVRAWIDRLSWHPNLPLLAVATGKQVQIWQVDTQNLLTTLPFDRSSIFDLCWHPAGSHLAVAGYGGVAVWQIEQWQQYELLVVDTVAHRVAWSGDGSFLAAATIDRQLTIAALAALEQPWIIPDLPAKISQLQWLVGEPVLAIVSAGELICWQYAQQSWHPRSASATLPSVQIAAHPQLPILAAIHPDSSITFQDADLTILEQIKPPINNSVTAIQSAVLQWNPAGDRLIIGQNSGQLSCGSIYL
jgi:WD40 repeat protein